MGSDRKMYELVKGGANIRLTWANRKQYIDALLNVSASSPLCVIPSVVLNPFPTVPPQ